MRSESEIRELATILHSFLRETKEDNQRRWFFRMAEIGLMQGYSPEGLADYLRRFYNASKGKRLPEIPVSTARAVPVGDGNHKTAPVVRRLADRE